MARLRRTLLHRLGRALLLLGLLLLLGSMHPLLLLVLVLLLLLLLLHRDRSAMLLLLLWLWLLLLLLWLGLLLIMHALGDQCMSTLLGDFAVEAACIAAIGSLRIRRERRLIGSLVLDGRAGIAGVSVLRRRHGRVQLMLGLHVGRHRWRLARRLRLGVPRELRNLEPGQLLLPALSRLSAASSQNVLDAGQCKGNAGQASGDPAMPVGARIAGAWRRRVPAQGL